MHAHKLTVRVPASGHVELELPSEFRGGEAEVIVLFPNKATEVPQEMPPRGSCKRVEGVLAQLDQVERPRMTKEEIDALVAEERASWGDEP
jgi:hypothetical protein